MIIAPIVIIFALMGFGFYNDTEEFRAEVAKDKELHDSCKWKYVGKKDLDPTAKSIPLVPPVGEPYVVFKHTCK